MGWEELTQGERRIGELVAEQLTNREIGQRLYIEASTVHWHLKNIFKKLDINSRSELAAVVREQREAGRAEAIRLDENAGPVEAPRR